MSNGKATAGTAGKATIYFQGGYGMSKIEVRSVEFLERSYAQYSAAYEINFVKKGARRQVGVVVSDHPSYLIIEGWITRRSTPRSDLWSRLVPASACRWVATARATRGGRPTSTRRSTPTLSAPARRWCSICEGTTRTGRAL